MQPLGKRKRTQSGSHARSILRARRSKRRLRSSHAARKSRNTPQLYQRLWNLTSASLVGLSLVYGGVVGGHINGQVSQIYTAGDKILSYAGFGIKNIEIIGVERLTGNDVTTALGAHTQLSLLGMDTEQAQESLETLPWVRSAHVMRILPTTLRVVIEERQPLAYWQFKGAYYLIGADGGVIVAAAPGEYGNMPLVVGEGAPHHAAQLLATLMRYPNIATRLKALIRVADRRWTIQMRNGPAILLPEKNVSSALRRLSELNDEHNLLERDLESIDLRIAGRLTLRPHKNQVPVKPRRIGGLSHTNVPSGDV